VAFAQVMMCCWCLRLPVRTAIPEWASAYRKSTATPYSETGESDYFERPFACYNMTCRHWITFWCLDRLIRRVSMSIANLWKSWLGD